MAYKKLVIISHTEHYKSDIGRIVGWGPTVNEINYLADYFDEIVHIACFLNEKAPLSSNAYVKDNVKFVAIPPFGGNNVFMKLGILFKMPNIIHIISKELLSASHVQLRLPTGIGVFLLPYFAWFRKRNFIFWVKYAGNWAERKPPLGYKFQRWFLVRNYAKCNVTINGFWENQPKHCISFENPCLKLNQIDQGFNITYLKTFHKPYRFVFVGRLEDEKGVQLIIDAFKHIDLNFVESIDFIGDGIKLNDYKKESEFLGDNIHFHGFLSNSQVHEIIKVAHFFLLPSKGEGFPKVIAEAACYGVIPIVSNVGSIGHYINENNGFLCDLDLIDQQFNLVISELDACSSELLKNKSTKILELAKLFTFDNYLDKLNKYILA